MSHNPYEPPQSDDTAESRPEGFRWRLIPVALMGGVGVLFCVGGVFTFVMMVVLSLTAPPESDTKRQFLASAGTNGFVGFFTGLWLIFAAYIGWKGRWKTAIAMGLGLYLLVVAVSYYVAA